MSSTLPACAAAWLADVRTRLAALPPSPPPTAIARLADGLAAHALRLDLAATRTLGGGPAPRGRYHRRLLTAGDEASPSALLISWPRAHRTPLHDHAGLWGIELVLDGALEVEEYRIGEDENGRTTPVLQRRLVLGAGDAAVFGGADYAHRCRNLSATHAALSLHVYGGTLDHHHAYEAGARDGYVARPRRARIDAVTAA
jgi:hypothetical protein